MRASGFLVGRSANPLRKEGEAQQARAELRPARNVVISPDGVIQIGKKASAKPAATAQVKGAQLVRESTAFQDALRKLVGKDFDVISVYTNADKRRKRRVAARKRARR